MKRKLSSNMLTKLTILVLCLITLTFTASAQKRKPVRKPAAKPAATGTATTMATTAEIRAGADKVSTQIKNLSKFIFVLGGVAKDIEAIDADIRARKITRQTVIDQNTKNKQAVVQTIQNLRAGLVALEIEFRTKPGLKNYLFQVQGISDLAANAEDQANGGQLSQSGKTLLLIVEKLSDALVSMP